MGDVLGWLIALGIVALAFSTTLLVVRWAYRRRQVREANDPMAILVALAVGLVSLVGGWLLIDVYLLMRSVWRVTGTIPGRVHVNAVGGGPPGNTHQPSSRHDTAVVHRWLREHLCLHRMLDFMPQSRVYFAA